MPRTTMALDPQPRSPSRYPSEPPPDVVKSLETRLRSPTVEPPPLATITVVHPPEHDAESTEPDPSPEQPTDEALDTIDMETFHQILDLDEDDTHDFSRGMAWAYFSQASTTFVEMDDAHERKDLAKLSALGHFLKGSSAALGVAKVQASCEKIQHYGQLRDEEAGKDLSDEAALEKIKLLLVKVKAEYAVAEKWLRNWYAEHGGEEPEPEP